ncbi:iron-dependent repressor [Fulvitalea axinellae]|uniref:Transcriptional regulator MntR n=1 Tax=Fulvitalea axinellae TaxID=1182444 RepID=A0AAU9D519_9BACT|nr:iron-dependent repressor [Fulvitalea axinellae]
MLSFAEENYLKIIYLLSKDGDKSVATNAIAEALKTKPASVSDMIRKLADKNVITYIKYQGVNITPEGRQEALLIIRKHRIWEVFLCRTLRFNWDEVHDVAEQLEHIKSKLLIDRLDEFLDFPRFDPHGDPIPDKDGNMLNVPKKPLAALEAGATGTIAGVENTSSPFLKYLDKIGASIGSEIAVLDKIEFDGSMEIRLDDKSNVFVSNEVAKNILVAEYNEGE